MFYKIISDGCWLKTFNFTKILQVEWTKQNTSRSFILIFIAIIFTDSRYI